MAPTSTARRRALRVVGAALLAGSAGRLLSATRTQAALAAAGPGLADFGAVSATLTGKPDLDPVLALALYDGMRRTAPGIDAALAALKAVLAQEGTLADKATFDAQHKPQQALSQAILQAWYLGVVGKGKQAACIAYAETLANRAVAAQLAPPSFSYGPCGSWHARP